MTTQNRWVRTGNEYHYTTYMFEQMVVYKVAKADDGWLVTRWVQGGGHAEVLGGPYQTATQAQAFAEDDEGKGF